MPLDVENGTKILQLMTSRYDQREWRKKIEKTLSLPFSGFEDDTQRKIFMYLKCHLQAYKSRRADPPSWIVGGYATREVIDRARLRPEEIDPSMTETDVSLLGVDPGPDVDAAWWEAMLVMWFDAQEDDDDDAFEVSGDGGADQEYADDAERRENRNVSGCDTGSAAS